MTNKAEWAPWHYEKLATERTITARGLDECDVVGCFNFVDVVLETSNHDRFCTACIDAAGTITDAEIVPPNWWKVTGPPEYQLKKNSVAFPVRLITRKPLWPAIRVSSATNPCEE
ncbi:Uncharacterised protein [Mycobacteroides abscessus subsp. bolletii]|uniref:hypothetical protein n=1 Tax=Mycobacteroides abscessus TaxID=36809 RepID=UPI0009D324AE|nr:hypothetical protein [Mycobacteroides abscessus]SLI42406.1 Uncharacterised protein [Mycobacteroides abscessus subsp. bolletii]